VIALLLGGGLALSSHGTKAATRALVNASPEPFSNVVVSLSEDVLAIVTILLAAFLPILVFLVIAAGLAFSFWILPRVLRFFRGVYRRVHRFFSPETA
jgi:Ca2+/Na+ antiporter